MCSQHLQSALVLRCLHHSELQLALSSLLLRTVREEVDSLAVIEHQEVSDCQEVPDYQEASDYLQAVQPLAAVFVPGQEADQVVSTSHPLPSQAKA
jgi:chromosome condensin MukBEF ATPase and DNA-binding subunit MukB